MSDIDMAFEENLVKEYLETYNEPETKRPEIDVRKYARNKNEKILKSSGDLGSYFSVDRWFIPKNKDKK
uniref:Uncharacterized protein n=1 Tax=viral metagenome TaxID=1070528 RepID=A0A6C0DK06_9ZZZZ